MKYARVFVFDIREAFKVLVPAKERMNAAERLIKICDDVGFQKEDIAEMTENDKILETAFDIYFQDDYDEDEDDDSWDDFRASEGFPSEAFSVLPDFTPLPA